MATRIIPIILLLWHCTPPQEIQPPKPIKEVVIDSLAHPWSIAFIAPDQAFITEKDGNLLRVDLASKEKTIINGFPDDLFTPLQLDCSEYEPRIYPTSLDGQTIRGNAGILDIVLDPDFTKNQEIYLSYISQIEKTYALKVIKAKVLEDRLTNVQTLLNPGPYVPGLWHFGGGLCIANGHLYVTVGERLFFEDYKKGLPIAQDVKDERGKIYRINLDGSIPGDNPDFGPKAAEGLYAFGIRAAQGIIQRPESNEIWFSEHGTIQGDELNILQAGANYGWPNITSGKWRSPGYEPAELEDPDYTFPQHFWLHTVAPTGLCFYDGKEFPAWKGSLMVPGLSRGSLWRMTLQGNQITWSMPGTGCWCRSCPDT
ncbi:MAG: PQQ-dependent sugar dehydrogenase, partial [Bacteroidota bacterium]